jgi:hypothetical protein
MPQYLTNTMRICTKDAKNARYDATVPVKPTYSSSLFFERTTTPIFEDQEYCSASPYEVPWSLEDAARADNPAAMFSVGNVPMWDGVPFASSEQDWLTSSSKYPLTATWGSSQTPIQEQGLCFKHP